MLDRWKQGERAYIGAGAERQPPGPVRASSAARFDHHGGANSRLHSLSAGLLALAVLTAPDVKKADCGSLADRHTAAAAKVIDALRSYEKCVSSGGRRNDCAAEMEMLDAAHDVFSDAVDDLKPCK
jgi:hypothetical protein